jgi:hypothetical protein
LAEPITSVNGCLNDAPCPLLATAGASITQPFGAGELEATASAATFTVALEEGEDQLFAAFYGRGGAVRAPYYLYIRRK